jgi:hypothetical protein
MSGRIHERAGRAIKGYKMWTAPTLCGVTVPVGETTRRRDRVRCSACGDAVNRLMGFPVPVRESAPVAAPAGGEER